MEGLVKEPKETINHQSKQIEELRRLNHRQTKEIRQLKSEIRRLKELKTKPALKLSKINKKQDQCKQEAVGKRPGSEKKNKREQLIIHNN